MASLISPSSVWTLPENRPVATGPRASNSTPSAMKAVRSDGMRQAYARRGQRASGVAGNVGGVDGERKPSDARTQALSSRRLDRVRDAPALQAGAHRPILEKYWCDREHRSSRKALPCDVRERSATQQIADAVCSRQPVKAPALTGLASSLLLKQAARAANVAGHITRCAPSTPPGRRPRTDHRAPAAHPRDDVGARPSAHAAGTRASAAPAAMCERW